MWRSCMPRQYHPVRLETNLSCITCLPPVRASQTPFADLSYKNESIILGSPSSLKLRNVPHSDAWTCTLAKALQPSPSFPLSEIWISCGLSHILTRWCVQVLRSPKEAFAAAMQSWRELCEKCVCLQGDYVEKLLHFQLHVVSSFI